MTLPTGLTQVEARRRLAQVGSNELGVSAWKSRWSEAKKILLDPMGIMLLVLAVIYRLLNDRTNSLLVLGAYFPILLIDLILDIRVGRALKALKATLQPRAQVLRDGAVSQIPTRELVPGDLLLFEEGEVLPADGMVHESRRLMVSEASLTGESIPLEKEAGHPFWSGTVVLSGGGMGEIQKTGSESRFGKIAGLMESVEEQNSPLRRRLDRWVKQVLLIALIASVGLVLLEGMRTGHWLSSIVIGLTLGMAAIPEEFPLVFTLYLSMGAWRLSKKGVLVKSLPSVETLGSVDVICTDKTGTLTEGVFELSILDSTGSIMPTEQAWLGAMLACESPPVDALEKSIELAALRTIPTLAENLRNWECVESRGFDRSKKIFSQTWRKKGESGQMYSMKGAPEAVLSHCRVSEQARSQIEVATLYWSTQGKRVLGLAQSMRSHSDEPWVLDWLGLLVFEDRIRSSVKVAIEHCQKSGIEIKVLTGDHPETAHAVVDAVGIRHQHDQLYTGAALESLSASARKEAYLRGVVFARILPEQKYELIEVLKAAGKTVAMTGDGINDAPALKLADIGISMGRTATEVARSASQMILLENDFSGIVEAIFQGRTVFVNLQKSFSYLLAFHLPVVLVALVPSVLSADPMLLPAHIIVTELVVHPVSAFTFEGLPTQENWQNLRNREFMTPSQLKTAIISGSILGLSSLAMFFWKSNEQGALVGRSAGFATLILGNFFMIWAETWPLFSGRLVIVGLTLLVTAGMVSEVSPVVLLLHGARLDAITFAECCLMAAFCGIPFRLSSFEHSSVRKHSTD